MIVDDDDGEEEGEFVSHSQSLVSYTCDIITHYEILCLYFFRKILRDLVLYDDDFALRKPTLRLAPAQ